MMQWLIDGLEYDLWANQIWLEVVERLPRPEVPRQIMGHILGAQAIWLRRCGVTPPPQEATGAERLKSHIDGFKTKLAEHEGEILSYENSKGERNSRPLEQIVRHVINHGTYHRGELRRIAEDQGVADFPDTDLIYFYDSRR